MGSRRATPNPATRRAPARSAAPPTLLTPDPLSSVASDGCHLWVREEELHRPIKVVPTAVAGVDRAPPPRPRRPDRGGGGFCSDHTFMIGATAV